ncbi:MAG: ABC transporter permease, partial [Acidithiobacillus sp.]
MKLQRLRGLIRKEFIQIWRDPSAIAIAFFMPVFLLFLFGYGVSLDARHVPVAVMVDQPSAETSAFIGGLQQSTYFTPQIYGSIQAARRAVMARRADGILWLRGDFSRQVLQDDTASIGVFVNGVDANNARILQGYLQGVWQGWL